MSDANMSNDTTNTDNTENNVEITPEMQSFYQRADEIIGVANSQLIRRTSALRTSWRFTTICCCAL